jgi:hypothetical protein
MRRLRVGRIAVFGLVVLAAIGLAPNASAKTDKCWILDHALDASYKSLQVAVDAADAGATLDVRGTCGGITTIDKNLTINGERVNGFIGPILDGDQQGSVLTVNEGVTVTVNSLTVTGGSASHADSRDRRYGGGIFNLGTLTLNDSVVSGNIAGTTYLGRGGGIYNPGTLTVNDSVISKNISRGGGGGGISNVGTLTLTDSTVSSNLDNLSFLASNGGGIQNWGTATLNGTTSISGNSATFYGGGVSVLFGAMLTLNGSTSISANTAPGGGGVYNEGSVMLNGVSSISGNTAYLGGGIYDVDGTLIGCVPGAGGNVFDNTPDDIYEV